LLRASLAPGCALGPKGNPMADNLFEVVSCLQKRAGIELRVA
jgi:hypothetical protein